MPGHLLNAARFARTKALIQTLRVAIVTAAVLAFAPSTASAQFIDIMEWLDKLSGPGPFERDPGWLPGVSVPIGCVTEVTTRRGLTEAAVRGQLVQVGDQLQLPAADVARFTDQTTFPEERRYIFEAVPRCLGLFGVLGATNPSNPPWGNYQGDAILRKRQVFDLSVRLSHLASVENELVGYPAGLTEADKQVKVFVYGIGLRYLPHEAAFLQASWDRHRFYSASDLFGSFDRDTRSIEIGAKPLWASRFRILQPFTVSAGVRYGLGRFVASDFGAIGPFVANDERTSVLKIGYDIWLHSCWHGLCR